MWTKDSVFEEAVGDPSRINNNTAKWHCQSDLSFVISRHQAFGCAPVPATNTHRLLGNGFASSVSCTVAASLIFDRWVLTSGSVYMKSREEFTPKSAPGKCIFSWCWEICVPGKRKQSNEIRSRIVSFSTTFGTHLLNEPHKSGDSSDPYVTRLIYSSHYGH